MAAHEMSTAIWPFCLQLFTVLSILHPNCTQQVPLPAFCSYLASHSMTWPDSSISFDVSLYDLCYLASLSVLCTVPWADCCESWPYQVYHYYHPVHLTCCRISLHQPNLTLPWMFTSQGLLRSPSEAPPVGNASGRELLQWGARLAGTA